MLGKVLFNVVIALGQAAVTVGLAATVLGVPIVWPLVPAGVAIVAIGTAAWFFFYAIFAIRVRQNDAFNLWFNAQLRQDPEFIQAVQHVVEQAQGSATARRPKS